MFIGHAAGNELQTGSELSHVGGTPTLPQGISVPVFEKTGTEMTFFFQFEFPRGHRWENYTMSVFAATDYVDDDCLIPKIPTPLAGAALDEEFFKDYQSFFRVIFFETIQGQRVTGFEDKIAFHDLQIMESVPEGSMTFGEIADTPNWMLEDESPNSFNGEIGAFQFLLQTKIDYEFQTLSNAPRQKIINYTGEQGLADSYATHYTLFTSNETYYFGIRPDIGIVYIVPQS